MLFLTLSTLCAQVSGTWDSNSNTGAGYTNWGSGVITLTDTTTNSGSCQGAAIHETSTTYNPNPVPGTPFSQCYRVFFGCPGSDQIGTAGNPYTDLNGDGMAFSFWKNGATFNESNGLACGGGLGYHSAASDGKMITIEFDTYSSIGTNGIDGSYGGGGPGSGINDEISVHFDGNSGDAGMVPGGTVNAGNLEDGNGHDVCISYTPGTHILVVKLDGATKLSLDLGPTYNLETYFGNVPLNQTWSAGKYGANNFQTIGPAGANLTAAVGHPFCTTLPVKIMTFTGQAENDEVLLNWTTASETNNKKFIIERSVNLSDWQTIGEMEGAGNSTAIREYTFTDNSPVAGTVYYRLCQVNTDGAFEYSRIISVETNKNSLSITPNPFEDIFIIKSTTKGDMDISIHDVLGRLVYSASKESENGAISIQPELPGGAYMLTIRTKTSVEQRKLIKR
ncbi:MAG: T9SS type A sorting domain-containing protein [Cytophagaceae bacterium]